MPDLRINAVHAFWDSYDRRVLYRVIAALESVESWAADLDPKIDQAIINLGQAMDVVRSVNFAGYEEKIINILAYLPLIRKANRIRPSPEINVNGRISRNLKISQ